MQSVPLEGGLGGLQEPQSAAGSLCETDRGGHQARGDVQCGANKAKDKQSALCISSSVKEVQRGEEKGRKVRALLPQAALFRVPDVPQGRGDPRRQEVQARAVGLPG